MQQMKQTFLQYNVSLNSIYFIINSKQYVFREYFSMIIHKYYCKVNYFRKILTSEIF